ncbi:MAG: hypothetical protein A3H31_05320 [Gallionellales bacterium RIFCSPLOWO2_02_FULL_57_47]|nr:MAG: hypothetical protein A3H31_05320 [Gallionellales bacterium RIFCSPLOWO2_02_FULL_57_47]
MQAIEFVSKAHDGVVDLPREYQGWNGKEVRVILLEATSEASKQAQDLVQGRHHFHARLPLQSRCRQ